MKENEKEPVQTCNTKKISRSNKFRIEMKKYSNFMRTQDTIRFSRLDGCAPEARQAGSIRSGVHEG